MSNRFKPYATVALIIEEQGKYLMVEEYNEDENNRLVFSNPCGHIDEHESILDAARREGYEETGCNITLLNLICIHDYVKENETIYRFTFLARRDDENAKLVAKDPDGEILRVRFYTKDEIYANKDKWRTRLVGKSFDEYFAGKRYPLDLIRSVYP